MLPADLSSLKVVDLRAELSNRDLSTKGKKDELVERLQAALEKPNQETVEDVQTMAPSVPAVEKAEPLLESTETTVSEVTVQKEDTPIIEKTEVVVSTVVESTVEKNTASPVIEKTEEVVSNVVKSTVEENTTLPVIEKTVEETKEKDEETKLPMAEKTEPIVEKTEMSMVAATPVAQEAPVAENPAVKLPNAETKAVTELPKENMDTDRTAKRRRSIESDDTQGK